MKKIKVFVVEDIEEIRNGFNFLINTSPEIKCTGIFSNAEDALFGIKKEKPDVIVMDIGLPVMSGIECTRLIKLQHPEIQILICSIYDDDERLFNALTAGANGYILKRNASASLIDAIKDIHNGGSPMSSQIARKVVSSFKSFNHASKSDDEFNLSEREMQILELLAEGHRNKVIADRLYISTNTVKSHIYHIYEKLHVQSRVEALKKISGGK